MTMALYPWFSSTTSSKLALEQSYLMACLNWPTSGTWPLQQQPWNKLEDGSKQPTGTLEVAPAKPRLSFSIEAILGDRVGRKDSVQESWTCSRLPTFDEKQEPRSQQQQQSRKKRSWSRAVFSNLQRKGLEKRFQVQKYITKPDRRQLAATLGLTDAQVKVWFQNRRMKWRHSKEKDSSGSSSLGVEGQSTALPEESPSELLDS